MSDNVSHVRLIDPEDYPASKRALVEDFNLRLSNSMGIVTGLAKEYHTIWLINRKTLKIELYRSTGESTVKGLLALGSRFPDYKNFIRGYVYTYVADRTDEILESVKIDNVEEKIKNGDLYSIEYMRINEEGQITYHQMNFALAGDYDSAEKIILAFKDVDKIVRKHMEDKRYLREQLHIVNALSRDYYNVFKIDMETGTVIILKLDG